MNDVVKKHEISILKKIAFSLLIMFCAWKLLDTMAYKYITTQKTDTKDDLIADNKLPYESEFVESTTNFLEGNGVPYVRVDIIFNEYLHEHPKINLEELFLKNDRWHPSQMGTTIIADYILSHGFFDFDSIRDSMLF